MTMNTAAKVKKRSISPQSLANLKIGNSKEHPRSEMKSFRMTTTTKESLEKKLSDLKMSLGDFIEAIAEGEVMVIDSDKNSKKVVAKIK